MTVSTLSNLETPHFNGLPHDIQIRIFAWLGTEGRARIAAVCRTWCQVSNANWTNVCLSSVGMEALQARLDWLQTIYKQSSGTLGCIKLFITRTLGDLITQEAFRMSPKLTLECKWNETAGNAQEEVIR